MFPPERIVCLTEETVETLYLLGDQVRVVGISGYCVRPPQARREKARVSAFTSADIPKILDLKPDLVLTFSDLQADMAAELIPRGIDLHAFNQRTIAEILDMIRMLGAMIGVSSRAETLANDLAGRVAAVRRCGELSPRRPRVCFEECDVPMISAIGWVSELITVAGGIDIFADRAGEKSATGRIVTADEIIAREPDIIIGSWCGKRFRPEKVMARPGFAGIPAIRDSAVYEIKSPLILQPGPAALTAGLAALQHLIARDGFVGAEAGGGQHCNIAGKVSAPSPPPWRGTSSILKECRGFGFIAALPDEQERRAVDIETRDGHGTGYAGAKRLHEVVLLDVRTFLTTGGSSAECGYRNSAVGQFVCGREHPQRRLSAA